MAIYKKLKKREMGQAVTGFYNLKHSNGQCLQNDGNKIFMHPCSNTDQNQVWYWDASSKTFCNLHSRNCLENGGSLSQGNDVIAYVNDGSMNKKWILDRKQPTDPITICNSATKQCLENGGAMSAGDTVAAYNDDGSMNKKWWMNKAECWGVTDYPTIKLLNAQHAASVCGTRCAQAMGTYESYTNHGLISSCRCNVPTACKL
jgi:hypothetical protein